MTTAAEMMALNTLIHVSFTSLPCSNCDYLVDARNRSPKSMTTTEVRTRALRGRPSLGWTLLKSLEAGSPPSLVAVVNTSTTHGASIESIPSKSENHSTACSHDADCCECEANEWKPNGCISQRAVKGESKYRTHIKRQIAPALLFVACIRICKRGPADDLIMSSIGPATKSRTTRKTAPVKTPIPTHMIMILGPSLEGFGISKKKSDINIVN